jgi:non-heme chloroperoxidase
MGAMVAQQFAVDSPSQIAGLMLMGGWATMQGHPDIQQFVEAAISQLTDLIDPAFIRDFRVSTVAREVSRGLIENAVSESSKVPARVWRAAFEDFPTTPPR